VPLYELVPTGDGIFAFRAPEVNADAVMEFEVSASDGEDTTTETVAITATNIVLTPEVDVLGQEYLTFDGLAAPEGFGFYSQNTVGVGSWPNAADDLKLGLLGIVDSEDGTRRELVRYPSDDTMTDFGEVQTLGLTGSAAGQKTFLTTIFRIPDPYAFIVTPIISIEEANKLFVTLRDVYDDIHLFQIHDVEAPCAVSYIRENADYGYKYHMVVGMRGGGLQLFPQLPDAPNYGNGRYQPGVKLADTGSFCSIFTNSLEVAAYDSESSEIRVWQFNLIEGSEYNQIASFPISLPDNGLELIDSEIRYDHFNKSYMAAFLMSDGQHDGQHELHVFYSGYRGELPAESRVYTWGKGRPTEIEYLRFVEGSVAGGFAVTLETAPYMIWVTDTGQPYGGDLYPIFSDLAYASTGLWATSVRGGEAGAFGQYSLTLTYTRLGKAILRGVISN